MKHGGIDKTPVLKTFKRPLIRVNQASVRSKFNDIIIKSLKVIFLVV